MEMVASNREIIFGYFAFAKLVCSKVRLYSHRSSRYTKYEQSPIRPVQVELKIYPTKNYKMPLENRVSVEQPFMPK